LAEGEERIGGGSGDGGWTKKKERKEEEGEGWWASPFDTQEVCGVPSRPTRSEYRRTLVGLQKAIYELPSLRCLLEKVQNKP
jgi:hypothetical protein